MSQSALATLLLVGSSAAMAQATADAWQVSEVSGNAVLIRDGQTRRAERGMAVPPGAIVATEQGGRVIVVHGRDFVTVGPASRVHVPAGQERQGLIQMVQDWGNAIFRIEKLGVPHFGVRTPYLAAVVKGTTFSITVTGAGASLQVVEGLVETSTIDGGARDLIRPGVVASVTAGDPFRMSVQGKDLHQIDSPQRGSAAGQATSVGISVSTASDSSTARTVGQSAITTATAASQDKAEGGERVASGEDAQVVRTAIRAGSPDLDRLTGGVVGNAPGSGQAMAATARMSHDAEGAHSAGRTGTSHALASTGSSSGTADHLAAAEGGGLRGVALAVSGAAGEESGSAMPGGLGEGNGRSGAELANTLASDTKVNRQTGGQTGGNGLAALDSGETRGRTGGGSAAGNGSAGNGGTSNGNAGSGNSGGGNSGGGNSGGGNLGGGNPGNGNAGGGNFGGGNPGNGNAGSGNAGNGNAGNGSPGG